MGLMPGSHKETWVVKCPKCGRVEKACKHITAAEVRLIFRLLRDGVEVFEGEEEFEDFERAQGPPETPRTHLYHLGKPRFSLDDLVLTPRTREAVEDALAEIRHADLIYRRWGLQKVVKRRKGVTLLFAGPPGTGKTVTAEALASALGRGFMVVNYAQLENLWVGETEKNIEAVFDEAAKGGAVLFFDEADSIFYQRGASAAPWTNRDVNVLLHHLENFAGVAVLATNMPLTLDRALARRIDLTVEFEMPTTEMREELLRRLLPPRVPLAKDVDLGALARRYTLSGGQLLNVIRQAIRHTLRRGKPRRVTMTDLSRAAEAEISKGTFLAKDHLGTWTVDQGRQRVGGYG
ncbi:MAG TPA: ATP-binding protein [Thermoplasmata archaeon]|nr:ATP-binding protein [Thermoplasmata archaeon]